ncbi:multidrug efflux pump subunit AcrA (membrane-fusion protein) [Catenulispora sp. MAP5-51]|uniref:biotin/lipoyl-binding protein n=1 Tax=Catenulispora sp. MAP5-51 TaxID=3156298 RepID=UPI003515EB30
MVKRDRVRGMNAALASGEAGVGEMRPARSPMRPRQMAVASFVAIAGSGLGLVTYDKVATKTPAFSGQVAPSHTYYLNFPTTGTVLTLTVKPGQHVVAGQPLATMDSSVAAANLSAAQAAVTADTALVAADQAPQATATEQAQDRLSLTQATAAVATAKSALTLAQTNDQHTIAEQTAVVTGDQNTYNIDNGHYTQQCAPSSATTPSSGPTHASAPSPSQSGSTSVTQMQFCQNLQSQVNRDSTDLSTAQAELAKLQSSTQLEETHDADDVTQSEAILTAAQQKTSAAAEPLSSAVIAQAKADLATAQSQVAADQLAVKNATLTAPADGVVADVAGAVGDITGSDGVHSYAGPAAQPGTEANQQPGFQLFVPPSANSGGTGQASGFQPLITVYAGALDVVAQIPEQNMTTVHVGEPAKLDFSATGTSVTGKIGQVMLDPAHVPGTTTYYDVLISMDTVRPEILAGMTVDVKLF